MLEFAGWASSSRFDTVAQTGIDQRRCIYALPAAWVERVTAALATRNVALFFCRVTTPITATNFPIVPRSDSDRESSLGRLQKIAAHLAFTARWPDEAISTAEPLAVDSLYVSDRAASRQEERFRNGTIWLRTYREFQIKMNVNYVRFKTTICLDDMNCWTGRLSLGINSQSVSWPVKIIK